MENEHSRRNEQEEIPYTGKILHFVELEQFRMERQFSVTSADPSEQGNSKWPERIKMGQERRGLNIEKKRRTGCRSDKG